MKKKKILPGTLKREGKIKAPGARLTSGYGHCRTIRRDRTILALTCVLSLDEMVSWGSLNSFAGDCCVSGCGEREKKENLSHLLCAIPQRLVTAHL